MYFTRKQCYLLQLEPGRPRLKDAETYFIQYRDPGIVFPRRHLVALAYAVYKNKYLPGAPYMRFTPYDRDACIVLCLFFDSKSNYGIIGYVRILTTVPILFLACACLWKHIFSQYSRFTRNTFEGLPR